jgi:hypothetical protein
MLCRRWKDAGQVTVTVDSALVGTVELYRANPTNIADTTTDGAIVPQDRLLLAQGYADVVHTVQLQLAATKNAGSSGFVWRFDAVELVRHRQAGQAVESNAPLQKVEPGSVSVTLTAQSINSAPVTFPQAFVNGAPTAVVVTVVGSDNLYLVKVASVTATGFTAYAFTRDASNQTITLTVYWIAVGS